MHSEILSKTDREEALAFYQSSRLRVSAELKHIDSMLRKLGGENTNEKTGVVLTLKGTKAKKRGPKSVWGKFILEKLKEQNHPLRYNDLINLAITEQNRSAKEHPKIRASILNSAFRLRSVQGKIATIGENGKKDKFLVLRGWINQDGQVREKDIHWLKEKHEFHPKRLNTDEFPSPRYAEDLD
jgi:hypothetical protein